MGGMSDPSGSTGAVRRRGGLWRRLVPIGLLAAATVLLVGATLEPNPSDAGAFGPRAAAGAPTVLDRILVVLHAVGVPDSFGFTELEVLANVLVFVPIGLLAALALPRRWWWAALLATAALSVGIEVAQLVAVPTRVASVDDVIANAAGGAIGAAAAAGVRGVAAVRPGHRTWRRRPGAGAPAGSG